MKLLLKKLCYYIYPDAKIRTSTSIKSRIDNKTVLLLGWGGSKPKNLKKIEEFYDSKDINWISFIMPLGTFQFVRNFMIKELIDTIKYNNKKNIFCHSYSNNGLWSYGELTQQLNNNNNNDIIVSKLIIDSAPHFIYQPVSIIEEANLLTEVMTSIVAKGEYYHPIYSPLININLILLGICSRFTTMICQLLNIPNHFIPAFIELSIYLRDKVQLVDTLFIYSNGDKLIPPEKIINFRSYWQNRNEKNILLQSYEFGDIPHTSSFYKQSDQYKLLLCTFFNID